MHIISTDVETAFDVVLAMKIVHLARDISVTDYVPRCTKTAREMTQTLDAG